jgi:UDP-N-acetylmuramoylalanine--D-glutamate ligase
MKLAELKDKKIVVLGLGVNNLHLVLYLLEAGLSLTIRDRGTVQEGFVAEHGPWSGQITWEVLKDITQKLEGFDIIFRSPSIPLHVLKKYQEKGATVTSQTDFFFGLSPAKIIGVTGTKGKGTTSTLIYTMLKAGYKKGAVYLGGNIGIDPFSFLSKLTENDLVILELSSFQLEDLSMSPHVAVVLRVTPDHLDHHASYDEYRESKARLLVHQREEDVAIVNAHYGEMRYYLDKAKGKRYVYSRHTPARQAAWAETLEHKEVVFYQMESGIESFEITGRRLIGEHNLENILPAVLVGAYYGLSTKVMQEAIREFPGLEHRLSYIGAAAGIDFYDDSIATVPESSQAAIESFPGRRIHLIVGGRDKGSEYGAWAEVATHTCTTISILPGGNSKKMERELRNAGKKGGKALLLTKVATPVMETILSGIHPHLERGDLVLLSPAAASDAPFKDYKVRGNSFIEAIHKRYAK